jgi:cell pole-organizing protein PopZ
MTQPAKGQEPSMEEILASIRRIIADDDPAKNPPKAAEPPRPLPMPRMVPPPPPEPEFKEDEIDTMLAQLQATSQPEPPVEEEPASDILELTEQMATPQPAASPAFRTISGQSDLMFEDNPIDLPPPPPPSPRIEEPRPVMNGGDRGLISAATSAAVDSAFNTLAQTVLVQNGRTLEDLVREMLRPMLKTWLDDNLPSMVERLVRAEIERVSRGRG